MFRNLFESMLTSINNRIDGVIKDLAELKSSLQFTQKDVGYEADGKDWKKSLENLKVK